MTVSSAAASPPIYPASDVEKPLLDIEKAPLESRESTPAPSPDSVPKSRWASKARFIAGALLGMLLFSALRSSARGYASLYRGCGHGANHTRLLSTNAELVSGKKYTLPSGDKIPSVALGTWKAKPGEVGAAVESALKAGYRHIDGAWTYGNEAEVGEGIKASGVAREDIWLTSKLWNTFHAPEDIEPTLDDTLSKLNTTYLDLYLIHWPVAQDKETRKVVKDLTENPYPTWKKLEELVDKGKIRNIGVSNFNIRRLSNLTANSLKYTPAINQVELSWFNPQPELLKWSKEHNILLEAYSPLGSDNQVKRALDVKEVKEVAKETGISPAQVILSWLHQRDVVILPKSVHEERIKENLKVYKLSKEAFDKIEKSATSHSPERIVDPSKNWGVDIFEDEN